MFDFVPISELTGGSGKENGDIRAVVLRGVGKAQLSEIKKQPMRNDYIRVKTVAVAVSSGITIKSPYTKVLTLQMT